MAVGVVIATCSATQDITIDALRIEQIRKEDSGAMAAGASMAVIGWWTGFKLGGMITLLVADKFELMGMENYWQMTFLVIGLLVIATNIGLLFIPETGTQERIKAQAAAQAEWRAKMGDTTIITQIVSFIGSTVVTPLLSFFRNNGLKIGLGLLSFILLFKIGEAFMGKMSIIFYKEVGSSKSDIAIYSKRTWLGGYGCLIPAWRLYCHPLRGGKGADGRWYFHGLYQYSVFTIGMVRKG